MCGPCNGLIAEQTYDSNVGDGRETAPAARRRVMLFAIAAALLAILPVLAAHHLPLLDAPAHEARLAALRHLLIDGHSDFYALTSFFLPDVAFDVIGLGLASLVGPEAAGQIFFALTLILTLIGLSALNRVATGRWSAVPLLAGSLLLYNLISILGFFSYSFGLALVLWALAGRMLAERASPAWRTLTGMAFGVVLLFCHVFDFGIYAVMSAGFALAGLVAHRTNLAGAALRIAEMLPALALFGLMSTSSAGHAQFETPFLQAKLFGLAKSVTSGSMTGDVAFVIAAALLVVLLVLCSRVRLVHAFVPGLAALFVLYLALPYRLSSGHYVDKRMPIAIALMLVSGLDVRIRRSTASATLIGLIGLLLVIKQTALAVQWRSFDPLIDKLAVSLEQIPTGAIIMQAECEPESTQIAGVYRERQPSMTHLGAMAAFDDQRFVASSWATLGEQPVRVLPAFVPYYNLEISFGSSTCDAAGFGSELHAIANLARAQEAAGSPAVPIYFLLIRPPERGTLATDARLAASDAEFELYEVRTP